MKTEQKAERLDLTAAMTSAVRADTNENRRRKNERTGGVTDQHAEDTTLVGRRRGGAAACASHRRVAWHRVQRTAEMSGAARCTE